MYKEKIYKEANAAYVKGIKGITNAVSRFAKTNKSTASNIVRKSLDHGGSGSFYGDMVLGAAKKIPGRYKDPVARKTLLNAMKSSKLKGAAKKTFKRENADILKRTRPLKSKVDDSVWAMKKNLDDIDMKLGDKLGKKNRIFDSYVDINHGSKGNGEVIQRLKVKRATAPLSKTKKAVLPMVGAMTISEKLIPTKKESEIPTEPMKGDDRFEQRYTY